MDLSILRRIPFLSALSTAHLREIYRIARVREVEPREAIFSKAELARHMFIVMSGRVKIFTRSASKKSKTFAYLSAGDFFGEMALLEGSVRSASAQAVLPTRILLIGKSEFKRLLLADQKMSYHMLRTVSLRLRRANEEIESLLFRNILGRVSKALCDLSRTSGKYFRGGSLLNERYTHQELADLVGTTREPLTRALSTLRRADLVGIRHGRYYIKDTRKLAGLCLTVG